MIALDCWCLFGLVVCLWVSSLAFRFVIGISAGWAVCWFGGVCRLCCVWFGVLDMRFGVWVAGIVVVTVWCLILRIWFGFGLMGLW